MMKRALLICSILLAAASSIPAYGALGTITGSVRDLNGKPISGATVYAYNTEDITDVNTHRAMSASDGSFTLQSLSTGSYAVHAYKESEGYPDTFYSFFATKNKKAWQIVQVSDDAPTNVVLELGPKYARLQLSIRNGEGAPIGAVLTFKRVDDPQHPYGTGVTAESELLVPPVPFWFEVTEKGYRVWRSNVIKPRSGEIVKITAVLTKSR